MHSHALAQAVAAMEMMQADLDSLAKFKVSESMAKQGSRSSLPPSIKAWSHQLREDPPSPIHHRTLPPVNDVTATWHSDDISQASGHAEELDQVHQDISKIVLQNDRFVPVPGHAAFIPNHQPLDPHTQEWPARNSARIAVGSDIQLR